MAAISYDIEPELQIPVPRPVRITFGENAKRVFFVLLAIGAMLGVAYGARVNLNNLSKLERLGKVVNGKIISRSSEKQDQDTTDYYLHYKFYVAGKPYKDEESVSEDEYNNTHTGAPILITYLPSNPTDNEVGPVTGSSIGGAIVLWIVFGGGFIIFFVILVVVEEWNLRWRCYLLREGTAIPGVIRDMSVDNDIEGMFTPNRRRRRYFWITCEYTKDDVPVSANFTVRKGLFQTLAVGEDITMICPPKSSSVGRPYILVKSGLYIPPPR